MKNTDIQQIKDWFESYAAAFLTGEEQFDKHIRLKIEHSYRVYERMDELAGRMNLKGRKREIALACALLHDAGRFEQYKRYQTSSDRKSVDHGELGAAVLKEEGVLAGLSDNAAGIIECAVRYHNAKTLPQSLPAEQLFFTELTRDADKIDIFRVVLEYYLDDNPEKDRTLVHELPEGEDISEDVFQEFMNDGHVTFEKMKNVNDFKIFQIEWLWDINNRAALGLIHRLGYIEKILATMPSTARTAEAAAEYRRFISVIDDDSWREISREKLHDCRIFSLYSSKRESSEGTQAAFYMIEAPDWVTVVPLVQAGGEDHFVMVRQYRHGSMDVTTEFPAGTIEPDEEPEVAALRELEEETGYQAGKITWLGSVNPNPAFLTNTFTVYLAEELVGTGRQNLDEHEFVDYDLVPVKEVVRKMGSGDYNNGTMLMALMYYLRAAGAVSL